MDEYYRSARLIYRAYDAEQDLGFMMQLRNDPRTHANASREMHRPVTKKNCQEYGERNEEAILGVVICLPPPTPGAKLLPIGLMFLDGISPFQLQHRNTQLAISLLRPYQAQGYGTEAINWGLKWGFDTAGLHRISIGCFSYNTIALKLYQKLGFREEGVIRECIWHEGRFWDMHFLGILQREWQEMTKQQNGEDKAAT